MTPPRVAGIDTWKPLWRCREGDQTARAMDGLATIPASRGSQLLPESVEGHRLGWFPQFGLIFAEGHPDPNGLCAPRELPGRLLHLIEKAGDLGIKLQEQEANWDRPGSPGFVGLGRLDLTANLSFDSPAAGLAFLTGCAAVLTRGDTQREVFFAPGSANVETIYLRGYRGKNVLGRIYDKGVESGQADRGMLIRPEDQRRWRSGHRRGIEEVADPTSCRELFARRFAPLYKASKGVLVANQYEIVSRLDRLVDEGEITPNAANRALASMVQEANGIEWGSLRTVQRNRRLRRELGLVLVDGVFEEVEVDVEEVLELALDGKAWGCG